MVQSATFDRNGVSIDNTELKGKSVSVDCSEFIQEKLTDNTFGERLRKSRLELGLSIPEVADMCNVTKSIISGYECNRFNPTKEVLNLLSSKFDMDYLCMEGYTKLVYNFDEFLETYNMARKVGFKNINVDLMLGLPNQTINDLGITKMDPELVTLIGKLNFRTSYGQNALKHSIEVANLCGLMAAELGENVTLAKRAGLLHDIGKSIDFEVEGSHVEIGLEFAKRHHEPEVVLDAIASHHGDTDAKSVIAVLVAIADTLSAARPGARNDSLENYIKRLEQLEEIGNSYDGVEKTFAMQAGRELRVIVKPSDVDDAKSYKIARDIKEKIENEMQYPGTIKITVIRETRVQEEAK